MEQTGKSNGVLNLDEMLGEQKLKVLYQGKQYELRTVKALTPEEFGKVMAYGEKFSTLSEADIAKDNGAVLMKAIDDLLAIIAPSLPKHKLTLKERFTRGHKRQFAVSLQEAIMIFQFWTENNRQKNLVRAG